MKHIDKHTKLLLEIKAFTLVELLVSIIISVLLLGGIFYFMSETILGISKASAQAKFLRDFYGFTAILDTGNIELLQNFSAGAGSDVALLTKLDGKSGLIVGIVNAKTLQLASTGSFSQYQENILGYRSLSESEIIQLRSTPNLVYSYQFFPDKVFPTFYMKNFQVELFNSGAISEMNLSIFPFYHPELDGQEWVTLPQDEVFDYSLVF